MSKQVALYPALTRTIAEQRDALAPRQADTFRAFGRAVFESGILSTKIKQLLAVAVAHITQCPYCIRGHTSSALRHGATAEEIMEAIWVATEMRAGAAYAHATLALDVIAHQSDVTDSATVGST